MLAVKKSPASAGDARDRRLIPALKDPPEEEMASYSSILV